MEQALKPNLEQALLERFGPLIGGADLRRALGFRSDVTFHRAARQGQLPVKVFKIEGRRGKYALTTEVAQWLCRVSADRPLPQS